MELEQSLVRRCEGPGATAGWGMVSLARTFDAIASDDEPPA
jgi:hypothetical protein